MTTPEEEAHRHRMEDREHKYKLVLITLVLSFCVYIASNSGQEDRKWTFGVIGTIIGYAVKGKI